jgi:hypothetical protein
MDFLGKSQWPKARSQKQKKKKAKSKKTRRATIEKLSFAFGFNQLEKE